MAKKPTVKERKLVKGIAQGKSITQAALDAYDTTSPDSAKAIGSRALTKVNVQEALHAEFQKQGITLEQAVAPIKKALNAKKVVQVEGDFYETEVDDLDMQIKGSDRALKLMGVSGKDDSGNTYNFTQVINEKGSKYND